MINKIYEKIKKYIIENYIMLIVLLVVVFLCFFQLPYVIYTPGGLVSLNERVNVEGGYNSDGSFNMTYVSMVKGTIPMLLVSYVMPNWDIVSKKDITYNDESIEELLKFERLQLQNSIATATLIAYEKAGKEINIKNIDLNIFATTDEAKTNVKKYDKLLAINDIEVKTVDDIRDVVNTYNEGDIINLKVLRKNKEVSCTAKLYKQDDLLLMGILFIESYDYETSPSINVKTKKSEAGASGGLMLTLTIYNSLVEKDITNGKKIAGTGTIEKDGIVGKIDGVKYKLLGAVKNKADMFICPKDNYDEAIKYKKELKLDIPIYGVETFDEALALLEK